MHNIAVICGDGIGSEVVSVALKVFDHVAKRYSISHRLKEFPLGSSYYLKTGEVLSDQILSELKTYDAIFLGAVGSPQVPFGVLEKGLLLHLRFSFDQYINLRPVRLYPCSETPLKDKDSEDIDFIVVRENTGGLYTGIGGNSAVNTQDEVAVQSMLYSYSQVERCLRYAFELACQRKRKILSLVGKANVLTHVFSLWMRVFNDLSKEFSKVEANYYHVDATCVHMINDPKRFDVIVTTNMFGDIITDLGAVLQGGMGMACSANLNPSKKYPSMFEPVHGSAPDIAGQNKANPLACVMSLKLMLDFLGERDAAQYLESIIFSLRKEDCSYRSTSFIENKLLEKMIS